MGEHEPKPREMERANTRGLHSCSRGQSGPECGDRNPGMHVRGSSLPARAARRLTWRNVRESFLEMPMLVGDGELASVFLQFSNALGDGRNFLLPHSASALSRLRFR